MKFKAIKDRSLPLAELSDSNFHRIAISNLDSTERKIARWWAKKYRTPLKPYRDHTFEELLIEMLEDYYEDHPAERNRFLGQSDDDWDGRTSPEHERRIQKRLGKIKKVDVSKYQDKEQLSEKDEKLTIENLGMNLPKSRIVKANSDEFEEVFD